MHHESSLRVTSLSGNEDLEISQLKTKIKTLEDAQMTRGDIQEDAPNRGGMMDQGEDFGIERDSNKSTNKGSKSTGEMANVLSSMGAANILASRGLKEVFTTASPPVPLVSSNSKPPNAEPPNAESSDSISSDSESEEKEADIAPEDTFGTITQRPYAIRDFPRGLYKIGESSSARDSSYFFLLVDWPPWA
ncbi:hypothetical protein Tco_0740567 [Tanacetum coccineum]